MDQPWRAYTDGSASATSSGVIAIGVVICSPERELVAECSTVVGRGTSVRAEVLALHQALVMLHILAPGCPAIVCTDSLTAIQIAQRAFFARHELDAVSDCRREYDRHEGRVDLHHVRGHCGVWGNDLADWLAGRARFQKTRPRWAYFQYRPRPFWAAPPLPRSAAA